MSRLWIKRERGCWCVYKFREPFLENKGFWELIGLCRSFDKLKRYAPGYVHRLTGEYYGDAKSLT